MAEIELLQAAVPALKVGIYLGVLVLTFLVASVYKKASYFNGLKIMSACFALGALIEFIHIMHEAHETIFLFLANEEVVHIWIHVLFFIGGLGLIWFINGIRKNIKDFK